MGWMGRDGTQWVDEHPKAHNVVRHASGALQIPYRPNEKKQCSRAIDCYKYIAVVVSFTTWWTMFCTGWLLHNLIHSLRDGTQHYVIYTRSPMGFHNQLLWVYSFLVLFAVQAMSRLLLSSHYTSQDMLLLLPSVDNNCSSSSSDDKSKAEFKRG